MKVKELIEKLNEYNQEAELLVVAHNKVEDYSICFGNSDGCTKQTCENVSLYLDKLNGNEIG